MSRRALVGAGVVVILLVLGVIGYTQDWAGSIFADTVLNGDTAAISTKDAFDAGTYNGTVYANGVLQLEPAGSAQ